MGDTNLLLIFPGVHLPLAEHGHLAEAGLVRRRST